MKTLNNTHLIVWVILVCSQIISAQDAPQKFLNANEVYTTMSAEGNLFWDGSSNSRFRVPYVGDADNANAIFAGNIGVLLRDESQNISGHWPTYGHWTPGMLDETTGLPFTDTSMSLSEGRVFSVTKDEVIRAQLNLIVGVQLDEIPADILEWPARGNAFYQGLLDDQDGAPFFDENNNGVYEPTLGDYPIIGADLPVMPDQLLYSIVHHDDIEVHNMLYTFYCDGVDQINRSVYQRATVFNRSSRNYSEISVGHWMDYDLGCGEDDKIGCDSIQNAFYVYNADEIDGNAGNTCTSGAPTFSKSTFSGAKILGNTLASFTGYWSTHAGGPLEYSLTDDNFYKLIDGVWPDDTPITPYGTGYNPLDLDSPTTQYLYHGNPNEVNSWVAGVSDWKVVGTQRKSGLAAGMSQAFDIVHTVSQSPTLDNIEIVNLGIENLSIAAQFYDDDFDLACLEEQFSLGDPSSIYPGDVDNDEIVNGIDFMKGAIAIAKDTLDQSYRDYISDDWKSFDGDDRTLSSMDGVNNSHADCNGDGTVDYDDLNPVIEHYNKTTPYYTPNDYPCLPYEGEGSLELDIGNENPSTTSSGINFSMFRVSDFNDIYTFSFELLYDPTIFTPGLGDFSILLPNGFESVGTKMLKTLSPGIEVYGVASSGIANSSILDASGIFRLRLEDNITQNLAEIRLTNIYIMDYEENLYCLDDRVYTINFSDISSTVEIADYPTTLYPNPTSGQITINTDGPIVGYQAFSLDGRLVQDGRLNRAQSSLILNQDPGVYNLQLQFDDGSVLNRKVVVW